MEKRLPTQHAGQPVPAVVMNLYYTGLGIARSLGRRGVPVIGLAAQRVYGNYSRHVKTVYGADSRTEPEQLLQQLLALGRRLGGRSVLFPTRDHDLVFLDRFRTELEPYFVPMIPTAAVLKRCLDKWETYVWAKQANVPTPACWLVEDAARLREIAHQISYPCVLKPISAHVWRTGDNWDLVGGRKAIVVASPEELLAVYATIARADRRVLVQEHIPGGDDHLIVAACYLDRRSRFQGGFNIQKLVQTPVGVGTGCIVQSADRPELFERTTRLLQAMEFTGIAEVEYKWDERDQEYKLIEINPRPWDQHTLGAACGVDLIPLAYCEYAGLPKPHTQVAFTSCKWLAEDAFLLAALGLLWRREAGLGTLLRQARGKKMYAIWSIRDPLPFVMYLATTVPALIGMALRGMRRQQPTAAVDRHEAAIRTAR